MKPPKKPLERIKKLKKAHRQVSLEKARKEGSMRLFERKEELGYYRATDKKFDE